MSLAPHIFFDLEHYAHRSLFTDCLYVWDALARIKAYLQNAHLGLIACEIPAGAWLVNPETISIGPGTIIEPGAYIRGPCIIGANCSVRHGAYIRGEVIVGDRCVIGHASEVKSAIFLDDAHASHFAYVGDSILGNKVNLGAGTKLANLKLNSKEVIIHYENIRVPTRLRKFGAILGDRVQLGCNSVTNPGTLMGKDASCHPCINFGGYIPPRTCIAS